MGKLGTVTIQAHLRTHLKSSSSCFSVSKNSEKKIHIKGMVFLSGNSRLGEHAPIVVWMHTKTQMDV